MKPWNKMSHREKAEFWGEVAIASGFLALVFDLALIVFVIFEYLLKESLMQQARFQKLRNDLFWEVFDMEQDKIVRWMGYDDAYWWNNVAKSEQFQVRGKYKLNPFTNEVIILPPSAGDGAARCSKCKWVLRGDGSCPNCDRRQRSMCG